MPIAIGISLEARRDAEAREAALTYVSEAFALAALDDIDADALAEAALCAAKVAARLTDRVCAGEFSDSRRH